MYGPRMLLGPEVRSTTRGVLYVHSAPSALCPHIEWAAAGVLGMPVAFDVLCNELKGLGLNVTLEKKKGEGGSLL